VRLLATGVLNPMGAFSGLSSAKIKHLKMAFLNHILAKYVPGNIVTYNEEKNNKYSGVYKILKKKTMQSNKY